MLLLRNLFAVLVVKTSAAPPPVPEPAPVCRVCGACPRNETWHGFAMPIGIDMLVDVQCAPAAELGQNFAWLPVTHTRAGAALGLWYYYARGCSDMAVNVGRTLLARNRVHGALMLEALLLSNKTDHPVASLAVATRLRTVFSTQEKYQKWQRRVVSPVAPTLRARGANVTLENALDEAARGIYNATLCNPSATAPITTKCRGSCLRRPSRLVHLAAEATLDIVMWKQIRLLRSAGHTIDTIQLHQQPQGGGAIRWTTEVWDVRADAEVLPRWLNGSKCARSSDWRNCYACMGSRLEHCCQSREWQSWCDTDYGRQRAKRRGTALCGRQTDGATTIN